MLLSIYAGGLFAARDAGVCFVKKETVPVQPL